MKANTKPIDERAFNVGFHARLTNPTQPDEHLLVEATIQYSSKGHVGPASNPRFFKASSLVQMMSLTEGYIVTLSGRRMWLQ